MRNINWSSFVMGTDQLSSDQSSDSVSVMEWANMVSFCCEYPEFVSDGESNGM